VTLNHWDMPEALLADRGWVGRISVAAFAEFTQAVAGRLGDRVEWWVTQNEPWIVSLLGYRLGIHAPGISDLDDWVAAGHHTLLAHGVGADILHANTAARVGCALSLFPCDPASESVEDAAAAWGSDGYVNRWYLDPLLLSSYPTDMREHFERALGHPLDVVRDGDEKLINGRSDVIGVNYYTRGSCGRGKRMRRIRSPGGSSLPRVTSPAPTTAERLPRTPSATCCCDCTPTTRAPR
jgi:beta-glucosidase